MAARPPVIRVQAALGEAVASITPALGTWRAGGQGEELKGGIAALAVEERV